LSSLTVVMSVSLLLVACGGASSTGPGGGGGSLKHPSGISGGKMTGLTGRPFGIAVNSSGTVYVTQQDANSVARFTLSTLSSAGTPVAVTADPGDVIFNRAGTRAYASTFFGGQVH